MGCNSAVPGLSMCKVRASFCTGICFIHPDKNQCRGTRLQPVSTTAAAGGFSQAFPLRIFLGSYSKKSISFFTPRRQKPPPDGPKSASELQYSFMLELVQRMLCN